MMPSARLANLSTGLLALMAALTVLSPANPFEMGLTSGSPAGFSGPRAVSADDASIAKVPLRQRIDYWIERGLETRGVKAAPRSDDAEFLRRVSLDLNGLIPTADRVRRFLADGDPEKRLKLVDELLASPDYALHMARAFDAMLTERRVATIASYDVAAPAWQAYLAAAFAENRPWDRMVRDLLSSDGTEGPNAAGAKFFLVRDVAPHQLTRDVGRLFLGIDLQCAQCHDDPRFEDYRQADYYGIYAFLQRMVSFRDMEKNVSLIGETAQGQATFTSVFTAKGGETQPRLPGGEMISDPPAEKDKLYVVAPGPKTRGVPAYSRRLTLAERLPKPETAGFARNIANRLWALMLGRGLIHPLDLTHAANRPTHPELLAELEQFLVTQQFDMQALLREIALSETYQRSSVWPEANLAESNPAESNPAESKAAERGTPAPDAYAVAALRGLSPEQYAWSLLRAAGRLETHEPNGASGSSASSGTSATSGANQAPAAADLPPWRQRAKRLEPLERQAKAIIGVFAPLPGQPDGEFQPAVDHALFLLNNPAVYGLAQGNATSLAGWLEKIDSASALADELYLSVLGRHPTAEEQTLVAETLAASATESMAPITAKASSPPAMPPKPAGPAAGRRDALQGLVWGLMLSAEFRLNH
jgi:hypothetical protein